MHKCYTLTGTHCTGKTTLYNEIQKFYGDKFVYRDSQTRSSISREERRLLQVTNETQLKVIEGSLAQHKLGLAEPDNTWHFLDRWNTDLVAYTMAFYKQGLVDEFVVDKAYDLLQQTKPFIEKIFYLPVEFDLVDDGERSMDQELRILVDQELQNLLDEVGIHVVKLTGSIEERMERVKKFVLF